MGQDKAVLYPGATLGMLGGGQLGRMFTVAALQMGYRVVVLDPDPGSPAGQLASKHLLAGYDDEAALQELARCDAVTIEFENIPLSSMRVLEQNVWVSPSSAAVEIAQDRLKEKNFANKHGVATARYALIETPEDIPGASEITGFPSILKTARLGYDGKGQAVCENLQDVVDAFELFGGVACVLEQKVSLATELSVVVARGQDAKVSVFPVAENMHENGILDITVVPARVNKGLQQSAVHKATALAAALEYTGVMAVEFFITNEGDVLMNEIAPRPHNSGHYTLDATSSSQFDLQVLAVCGLPLPECQLLSAVAMLNLLGERWGDSTPVWSGVFDAAASKVQPCLHLYGKQEARPGRKMGHVNFLAAESAVALDMALLAKEKI